MGIIPLQSMAKQTRQVRSEIRVTCQGLDSATSNEPNFSLTNSGGSGQGHTAWPAFQVVGTARKKNKLDWHLPCNGNDHGVPCLCCAVRRKLLAASPLGGRGGGVPPP